MRICREENWYDDRLFVVEPAHRVQSFTWHGRSPTATLSTQDLAVQSLGSIHRGRCACASAQSQGHGAQTCEVLPFMFHIDIPKSFNDISFGRLNHERKFVRDVFFVAHLLILWTLRDDMCFQGRWWRNMRCIGQEWALSCIKGRGFAKTPSQCSWRCTSWIVAPNRMDWPPPMEATDKERRCCWCTPTSLGLNRISRITICGCTKCCFIYQDFCCSARWPKF